MKVPHLLTPPPEADVPWRRLCNYLAWFCVLGTLICIVFSPWLGFRMTGPLFGWLGIILGVLAKNPRPVYCSIPGLFAAAFAPILAVIYNGGFV